MMRFISRTFYVLFFGLLISSCDREESFFEYCEQCCDDLGNIDFEFSYYDIDEMYIVNNACEGNNESYCYFEYDRSAFDDYRMVLIQSLVIYAKERGVDDELDITEFAHCANTTPEFDFPIESFILTTNFDINDEYMSTDTINSIVDILVSGDCRQGFEAMNFDEYIKMSVPQLNFNLKLNLDVKPIELDTFSVNAYIRYEDGEEFMSSSKPIILN